MKKNISIFVFVFILVFIPANASVRNAQTARQLAADFALNHNISVSSQCDTRLLAASTDTQPMYYVFNNADNKGFTIVSGSDLMPEIVGYSTTGLFDENNIAPSLRDFLNNYTTTAKLVEEGDTKCMAVVAKSKAVKKVISRSSSSAVAPLCKTKWGQGTPYNNLCPEYSTGYKSAVGCVATAMAQIMGYHKYPESLCSSIKSYTTSSLGIKVPYIEKGVVYNWQNMLDEYVSGSYNSAQAEAVATLMYHCGASVAMDYSYESGAYELTAAKSFCRRFGMDKDLLAYVERSDYSFDEWTRLMDKELNAKRPILYTGSGTAGGHAFVCDGSDGNGYYHINWGWNGDSDGYFDITILNPDGKVLGGVDTYAFGSYNTMLIGITPDNGKTDNPLVEKKLTLVEYSDVNLDDTVRDNASGVFTGTVVPYLANLNFIDLTRTVALAIKNADGSFQLIGDPKQSIVTEFEDNGIYYYNRPQLTFSYAIPAGTDRIYVVQSSDGGKTWYDSYGEYNYGININTTSTKLSLGVSQFADLKATISTSSMKLNIDGTVTVTISNGSSLEYNDQIYILKNDTAAIPKTSYYSQNLFLRPGETKTFQLTCKPLTGSPVYLWVTDNFGRELAELSVPVEPSEAPKLELIDMQVVNAQGTAGGYAGSQMLTMPAVYGGTAEFKFTVRNTGGDANVYVVPAIGTNSVGGSYYNYQQESYFVPGNADTDIIFKEKGNIGDAMCCCIVIKDDYDFTGMDKTYTLYGKTRTMSYHNRLFAYFADVTEGISEVNNYIPDSTNGFYNLSGQQVDPYYKGIIINNGRKILTK